jgi:hypothetical protein
VHRSSASAVRLLAAWQQQRRALTDRLEGLLLQGPTAVDRVAARAPELEQAMAAERAAFSAFVELVRSPGAGTAPVEPAAADPAHTRATHLHAVPDDASCGR